MNFGPNNQNCSFALKGKVVQAALQILCISVQSASNSKRRILKTSICLQAMRGQSF